MWLICKNKNGKAWKIIDNTFGEEEMFSSSGELFYIVESYDDKSYTEVYKIMIKLKNKNNKLGFKIMLLILFITSILLLSLILELL